MTASRECVVMMGGDTYIGPWSGDGPQQPDIEPSKQLEGVAPYLAEGDIVLINLEGPICVKSQPTVENRFKRPNRPLKMTPSAVETLKQVGVSAVCLANNQTTGYGVDGLVETFAFLEQHGIAYAGAGRNLAEARKPAIVEKDGVRLALLSYATVHHPNGSAKEKSGGVAGIRVKTAFEISNTMLQNPGAWPRSVTTTVPEDKAMVLDDVRQAKENADLVVVGWHWGLSGHPAGEAMGIPIQWGPNIVMDYQEEMGRACVDAGADLIMGHSPHRLQGMEIYRGALITYSLGDLAFGHKLANFGEESCIVKAYLDLQSKKFVRYNLLPIRMIPDTSTPRVYSPNEAGDIIKLLEDLSVEYGTHFETVKGEVSIMASE
ncbi:CapA family protein [Chloroflexota bacterium]